MRTSRLVWGAAGMCFLTAPIGCGSDDKPPEPEAVSKTEQAVDVDTGLFYGEVDITGSLVGIHSGGVFAESFDPSYIASNSGLNTGPVEPHTATTVPYELRVEVDRSWRVGGALSLERQNDQAAFDWYQLSFVDDQLGPTEPHGADPCSAPSASCVHVDVDDSPVHNLVVNWVQPGGDVCHPPPMPNDCTLPDEIHGGNFAALPVGGIAQPPYFDFHQVHNARITTPARPMSTRPIPMRSELDMKLALRYSVCADEYLDTTYYKVDHTVVASPGDETIALGNPAACSNVEPADWTAPICESIACAGPGGGGTGGGPGTNCPYNTAAGFGCIDGYFAYEVDDPAGISSFSHLALDSTNVEMIADEGPNTSLRRSHLDDASTPPLEPPPPSARYFHMRNVLPSTADVPPWDPASGEAPVYRVSSARDHADALLIATKETGPGTSEFVFQQKFRPGQLENDDRVHVMAGEREQLDRAFVFDPSYVDGKIELRGTESSQHMVFFTNPSVYSAVRAYGCGGKETPLFTYDSGWQCGTDGQPGLSGAAASYADTSVEAGSRVYTPPRTEDPPSDPPILDKALLEGHYTMPLAAPNTPDGLHRQSVWNARRFDPYFRNGDASEGGIHYLETWMAIAREDLPSTTVTLDTPGEIEHIDHKYCMGELQVPFDSVLPTGKKFYDPYVEIREGAPETPDLEDELVMAGYATSYTVLVASAFGTPRYWMPHATSGLVNLVLPEGEYELRPRVTQEATIPGDPDDAVGLSQVNVDIPCGARCSVCPGDDGQLCVEGQDTSDQCADAPSGHFWGSVSGAAVSVYYTVNGGSAHAVPLCENDGMDPSCDCAGDYCYDFTVDPSELVECDNVVQIVRDTGAAEPCPFTTTIKARMDTSIAIDAPTECFEDEPAVLAALPSMTHTEGCFDGASPEFRVDDGANSCEATAVASIQGRCDEEPVSASQPIEYCHLEPPKYPELESCYATWAEAEAAVSAALPGYDLSFSHLGEDRPGHACAGTLHVETEICDTTHEHDYPLTIGRLAPELPEMPEGCYPSQVAFLDAVRAGTITDCGSGDLELAATPSGDVCNSSLAVSASYQECPGLTDSASYPGLVFEDVKPAPMVDIAAPAMCYADEPALLADLPNRTTASGCLVGDPLIAFGVIGGPGTCDATSTASVRDVCGKTASDSQAEQYCGPGEPTWPDLAQCYGGWDEAEDIIRAANPAHVLVFTRIGEDEPGHACAGKLLVETKACDTPYSHSYDLQIGRKAPVLPEDKPSGCLSDIGAFLDWVRDGTVSDCGSDDLLISYIASSEICAADITVTASYGHCPELGLEDSELYQGLTIDGTPPAVTEGTLASCWLSLADAEAAARAATGVSDNCTPDAELRANMTHTTTGTPCDAVIAVTTTDACGLAAAPPAVYDEIHADGEPPVLTETDPDLRDLEWCDLVNDAAYRPESATLPPDPNDPAMPSSPADWFCFDSSQFMTMTDNCDATLELTEIGIKEKCEHDCREEKEECRDECDDTRDTCRAACPAGGAGNACRNACDDTRGDCREQCDADENVCNTSCGGGKCRKACNEVRRDCRDECKDTRDACRDACAPGDHACRDACEDARKVCDDQCDVDRDACNDACPDRNECRRDCDDTRDDCKDVCDDTRTSCRAACAPGGAGAACRSACDDARAGCDMQCEEERNECRDDCDLDPYDVIDLEADGVFFFDNGTDRFCLHREFFPEENNGKLRNVDGEMRFVARDDCNTTIGEADFTIDKCDKCNGQPLSCQP